MNGFKFNAATFFLELMADWNVMGLYILEEKFLRFDEN